MGHGNTLRACPEINKKEVQKNGMSDEASFVKKKAGWGPAGWI